MGDRLGIPSAVDLYYFFKLFLDYNTFEYYMLALMMYFILFFFLSERSETMACSSLTLSNVVLMQQVLGLFMNSLIANLRDHTRG